MEVIGEVSGETMAEASLMGTHMGIEVVTGMKIGLDTVEVETDEVVEEVADRATHTGNADAKTAVPRTT